MKDKIMTLHTVIKERITHTLSKTDETLDIAELDISKLKISFDRERYGHHYEHVKLSIICHGDIYVTTPSKTVEKRYVYIEIDHSDVTDEIDEILQSYIKIH